jgi:hypothetical protein
VLVHLDAETALGVGVGGPCDAAVQADERDGGTGARQAHALRDLGDRPYPCVLPLVARNEQHALLVTRVHRDGDVHVRKDDDVVCWSKQQCAQDLFTFLSLL